MGRTVTLRPNGLVYTGTGYWFKYPGSNAINSGDWGYQQDNDDGTFFYGIMSNQDEFHLDFTSYTLGGNERCSEARLVQRIRGMSSSFPMNLDSWVRPVVMGDGGSANYHGTWTGFTTVWNPGYGAEFDQNAINQLRACFRKLDEVTTPAVSEVYMDLWVQTQPTISITAPSWNQRLFPRRPTLSWNYDSKGDSVREHQVKVFTAATVEGGGFDVNSSPTVWSTQPGGAANSATVGVDLSYGTAYYYYVRIATDFRGASWWSAWQAVRFIINSPSVTSAVTVTPASPITTTNRPTIGWTYSDVDGDAQEHYYVRVFPESVYSAGGFTPDTDVGTAWNSGTVADSAARSAQTGPLSPNVNYKAWVYTTDMGSGTRWSTPAVSSVFVIQTAPGVVFDPPGTPEVLTVSTDQTNQRLAVTFQGRGNMMTRNQASADTGTVGMEPDANLSAANLVRDTTVTLQGGGAWKMTPTANGTDMGMRTTRTGGRGPFPVTPGRLYTALGSAKSSGVTRNARLLIRWYKADGTASTTPTTTGSNFADNPSTWVQASVSAIAPADAAWAEVVAQIITGTAEAHYWENLSFAPGGNLNWSRGGLAYELGQLADSFTRADSATSLGSADVGGAWTALAGTWGIQGNRGYMVTATDGFDGKAVLTSAFLTDGYVEADIDLGDTRAVAGLVFRAQDDSNMLMVEIARFGATDTLYLYKRVTGTWTALASITGAGIALGATVKLRAEFYGGQIYVYVNGVLRISYLMLAGELNQFGGGIAGSGTYGKYGIRAYRHSTTGDDGTTRFDNFKAGLLPTQTLTLERSLDGGVNWENVRHAVDLAPLDQSAIVYDYEVPSGVLAQYRVRATASEAGSEVLSGYSPTVAQSVALTITTWWLKDAVDPSLNMTIKVAPPFQFKRKEVMSTFDPVGREEAVFVSDGAKGIEGTLNVWCHDRTTYDKLEAILGNGRAVLLQDPLGRAWWVKFGEQDWELIRAMPQLSETTPIRHFHGLSLPFVQVGAPAVL